MDIPLDPTAAKVAWQAELDNAFIYTAMADAEASPQVAEVYRNLAQTERGHAAHLAAQLSTAPPPHRPSWRARTLATVARRLGPGAVLPTMLQGEKADSLAYQRQAQIGGQPLAGDEAGHARILAAIASSRVGGMSGTDLARLEGRHRGAAGNALRAAVLGANDGLVSNLSLVMGVAGAAVDDKALLLTGLAGLLAGAISMALGEWLSVQSSRELYTRQIGIEAAELKAAPEEEAKELALIYQAKGVPAEQAREMAASILANPDRALDTLVRGAVHRPGRTGRLGLGSGHRLLPALRPGSRHPRGPLLLRRRQHSGDHQPGAQRGGALRHRSGHLPLHRTGHPVQRFPADALRPARRGHHLWRRLADGRVAGGLNCGRTAPTCRQMTFDANALGRLYKPPSRVVNSALSFACWSAAPAGDSGRVWFGRATGSPHTY